MASGDAHAPAADAAPIVSVVIPCLNEERFIEPALRAILGGTWPRDRLEVLVVDGRSRDGTRAVVESIAREDPRVRLLDNPRGATPVALNIGIRAARGEVIVRADAHSLYPPNYVEVQVRALLDLGVDMTGPVSHSAPAGDSPMARAISTAMHSAFGTGAPYRVRRRSGPADAVALGCWRRSLFDRIGLFDERLLRNQDNEHSARILHAGGTVHLCTEVQVHYLPRTTLRAFMAMGVKNGTWNAFTERLHPYTFRWRHFLPALFFLGVVGALALIAGGLATSFAPATALGVIVIAPYTIVMLASSAALAWRERRPSLLLLLPAIFTGFHFAYGYGIVRGWTLVATGAWRARLGRIEPAPEEGKEAHG